MESGGALCSGQSNGEGPRDDPCKLGSKLWPRGGAWVCVYLPQEEASTIAKA